MAITVVEQFKGRTERVGVSAQIPFLVTGAADEDEVKTAIEDSTPTSYADMPRYEVEISERINPATWRVVVHYKADEETPDPESTDDDRAEPTFSFDIGAGTQHITQSLNTLHRYGPNAVDLGGAIGFDGENVVGVDIVIPTFIFSETLIVPASQVTFAYKAKIFYVVGKTNSASFRGFSAGEVMFLGAGGSCRGDNPDDDWEIAFKFAVSPNETGLTVGSISGIAKKSWEYLWVQYGKSVDTTKKVLIKRPVAVYIEQVCDETSFSVLGLGN